MTDAWVQLINGGKFSLDGSPHELDGLTVADIAKTLAQITRFRGATRYAYSVCQHSTLVSRIAENEARGHDTGSGAFAAICGLYGLIHDVHEIVVSDIPSPIKALAPGLFDTIEHEADAALWPIFGVHGRPSEKIARVVKIADVTALAVEKRDLCIDRRPWSLPSAARALAEEYAIEYQGDPQPAFMHRLGQLHRKLAAVRSKVPAE